MPVADILRVEIAVVARVGIDLHPVGGTRFQFHPLVQEQGAVGAHQFGEPCEPFEIPLLVAVDIEMVRVGGRDDGHIGCELMERTVELVGLYHRIVGSGREQEIRPPVA